MRTREISPEKTPELFFPPFDTGELDGSGDPIYTYSPENGPLDISDQFAEGKVLRKKSINGLADVHVYHDSLQIWDNDVHVVTARLYGEIYIGNQWRGQYFTFDSDTNIQRVDTRTYRAFVQKDIPALGIVGAVFGMEVEWDRGRAKQIFYLDVPGYLVRLRWEVSVLDNSGIAFSADDYTDNKNYSSQLSVDAGWTDHIWSFEQSGVICDAADERLAGQRFADGAGLLVDPYIEVTEQSSYIDVECDGYKLRWLLSDENWLPLELYGSDDTDFDGFPIAYTVVSGTVYSFGYDTSRQTTILEQTSERVILRVVGNLADGSQNALTNSDSFTLTLYIYPDRFFAEIVWVTSGGTIGLDDAANNRMLGVFVNSTNITNEDAVYENSGAESSGSGYTSYNSAKYLGILADELNITSVCLTATDASGLDQFIHGDYRYQFRWNNYTVPVGTHRMIVCHIIDSADREGSAKLYTSTERLEMGNQWKDLDIPALIAGSLVTDLNIPQTITDLAADGAIHVEPDSNKEVSLTNDITRHKQSIVVHDPRIFTGDPASPTDHLIGYWKCDDNAASTVVAAEVGSNGTLQGGDNTSDKSNSDAVRGTSLLLNVTDDYIDLSSVLASVSDFNNCTISFKLKTDADTGTALFLGHAGAWTDSLSVGLGPDLLYIYDRLGESSYSYLQYDYNPREFVEITISINTPNIFYLIDGQMVGAINDALDWSSNPTLLYFGARYDGTNNVAMHVDEIKLYNGCILPFGAYFTGNGSVDTAVAHGDVTMASSDGSTADIGTSIANVSNLDNTEGSLSLWVEPPSALNADETIFSGGTNFTIEWDHSDSDIVFTYGSVSIRTASSLAAGMDSKYHIKVGWEENVQITLEVNGIVETPVAASTAPTLAGSLTWSSNVGRSGLFITNNPNTPQIPTVFGQPVHVPMIEVA